MFINNKFDTILLRMDCIYNFSWLALETNKNASKIIFYLKIINRPYSDLINVFTNKTIEIGLNDSCDFTKLINIPFVKVEHFQNTIRYSSTSQNLLTCWFVFRLDYTEFKVRIERSFFNSYPLTHQSFEFLIKLNENNFSFEHHFNEKFKINQIFTIKYILCELEG